MRESAVSQAGNRAILSSDQLRRAVTRLSETLSEQAASVAIASRCWISLSQCKRSDWARGFAFGNRCTHVMSSHEIITLQFGSFANYVGGHYWNIQVKKTERSQSQRTKRCTIQSPETSQATVADQSRMTCWGLPSATRPRQWLLTSTPTLFSESERTHKYVPERQTHHTFSPLSSTLQSTCRGSRPTHHEQFS